MSRIAPPPLGSERRGREACPPAVAEPLLALSCLWLLGFSLPARELPGIGVSCSCLQILLPSVQALPDPPPHSGLDACLTQIGHDERRNLVEASQVALLAARHMGNLAPPDGAA